MERKKIIETPLTVGILVLKPLKVKTFDMETPEFIEEYPVEFSKGGDDDVGENLSENTGHNSSNSLNSTQGNSSFQQSPENKTNTYF
jgi:hypothetical protein